MTDNKKNQQVEQVEQVEHVEDKEEEYDDENSRCTERMFLSFVFFICILLIINMWTSHANIQILTEITKENQELLSNCLSNKMQWKIVPENVNP